jgi:hypothetical protein
MKRFSQPTSFDISKPQFDLYAFRSVRGDALAKYNSLNQSEPLRINLSALFLLTCLSSPWLAEDLGGESLTLFQTAAAVLGAIGGGASFLRECRRRSNQLTRMEKELEALDLPIRLPSNQLAETPFRQSGSVREIIRADSIRVLAVSGNSQELRECLKEICVLGRRLTQANAFVVIIPTDGSVRTDWGLSPQKRYSWLAEPGSTEEWKSYFSALGANPQDTSTTSFRWFGLTSSGRSFASGTTPPSWIQVLGKNLQPTTILDENDPAVTSGDSNQEDDILASQSRFYKALTSGNEEEMKNVFASTITESVTEVTKEGGRLDEWKSCLADGARPEGMKIADSDVEVISDTLAYSTTIEFPVAVGIDATLLAVQIWTRETSNSDWKLLQHQTIPWSFSPAGGTLICDCRGCVSLVRANERRTFGGLLG